MINSIEEASIHCNEIIDEVERAVVGKREVLEMIMMAVIADGHVLLEDFPGLGKTLIARSFATALGIEFKRIQFTPDLLPGEITGGYIFNRETNRFELHEGPIFANIILADEINRASPKTQSALLEAMQEKQVTLEGLSKTLPEPFIVLATQNPIEYEGTFPLPEAQLDRFMIKISVGYPTEQQEIEIVTRRKSRRHEDVILKPKVTSEDLLRIRDILEDVHFHKDLENYIVRIVQRTRIDPRVAVGASPRGTLAFFKLARARALLQKRDYVIPDDVKYFASAILSHRLILQPAHWMVPQVTTDVINEIFARIPVPVID